MRALPVPPLAGAAPGPAVGWAVPGPPPLVGPPAEGEVGPGTGRELVVAGPALDVVAAGEADEDVVAVLPVQLVGNRGPGKMVGVRRSDERVGEGHGRSDQEGDCERRGKHPC